MLMSMTRGFSPLRGSGRWHPLGWSYDSGSACVVDPSPSFFRQNILPGRLHNLTSNDKDGARDKTSKVIGRWPPSLPPWLPSVWPLSGALVFPMFHHVVSEQPLRCTLLSVVRGTRVTVLRTALLGGEDKKEGNDLLCGERFPREVGRKSIKLCWGSWTSDFTGVEEH